MKKMWVVFLLLAASPGGGRTSESLHSSFFDGSGKAESLSIGSLRKIAENLAVQRQTLPAGLEQAYGIWGSRAQEINLHRLHPELRDSFTFAVIGDAEEGRFFWERWWLPGQDAYLRQLRAIHRAGPDMVFQLGDFVSKGTARNYLRYLDFLNREVGLPMFHVIGNHDRSKTLGEADKTLYRAVFGDADFFVDYNGWRFVILDSSDFRVTKEQLDWLDSVLETPLRKVILTHVPPAYLKGAFHSQEAEGPRSSEYVTGKAFYFQAFFDEGNARFGEIVSRRQVVRVYVGHMHAFGWAQSKGVRYVLTGGGGSPLYPLPPGYPQRKMAHFLIVQAGPGGLHESVRLMDGSSFPIIFP